MPIRSCERFMLPLLLALHLAAVAYGFQTYQAGVPNGGYVPNHPGLGHVNPSGGGTLNAFGLAFQAAGYTWTTTLCQADSDGDGQSNGLELGDPLCTWAVGSGPPYRTTDISDPSLASSMTSAGMPPTPAPSSQGTIPTPDPASPPAMRTFQASFLSSYSVNDMNYLKSSLEIDIRLNILQDSSCYTSASTIYSLNSTATYVGFTVYDCFRSEAEFYSMLSQSVNNAGGMLSSDYGALFGSFQYTINPTLAPPTPNPPPPTPPPTQAPDVGDLRTFRARILFDNDTTAVQMGITDFLTTLSFVINMPVESISISYIQAQGSQTYFGFIVMDTRQSMEVFTSRMTAAMTPPTGPLTAPLAAVLGSLTFFQDDTPSPPTPPTFAPDVGDLRTFRASMTFLLAYSTLERNVSQLQSIIADAARMTVADVYIESFVPLTSSSTQLQFAVVNTRQDEATFQSRMMDVMSPPSGLLLQFSVDASQFTFTQDATPQPPTPVPPTTLVPPTPLPTTLVPPTPLPTTLVPPTPLPTAAPTPIPTARPPTPQPSTPAPSTAAPPTVATNTTSRPPTPVPTTTVVVTTVAPSTARPPTPAPPTSAPTTRAPTSVPPVSTPRPSTASPPNTTTTNVSTAQPTVSTPAPTTSQPITSQPPSSNATNAINSTNVPASNATTTIVPSTAAPPLAPNSTAVPSSTNMSTAAPNATNVTTARPPSTLIIQTTQVPSTTAVSTVTPITTPSPTNAPRQVFRFILTFQQTVEALRANQDDLVSALFIAQGLDPATDTITILSIVAGSAVVSWSVAAVSPNTTVLVANLNNAMSSSTSLLSAFAPIPSSLVSLDSPPTTTAAPPSIGGNSSTRTPTTRIPTSAPLAPPSDASSQTTTIIVAAVLSSIGFLALLGLIVFLVRRSYKKKQKRGKKGTKGGKGTGGAAEAGHGSTDDDFSNLNSEAHEMSPKEKRTVENWRSEAHLPPPGPNGSFGRNGSNLTAQDLRSSRSSVTGAGGAASTGVRSPTDEAADPPPLSRNGSASGVQGQAWAGEGLLIGDDPEEAEPAVVEKDVPVKPPAPLSPARSATRSGLVSPSAAGGEGAKGSPKSQRQRPIASEEEASDLGFAPPASSNPGESQKGSPLASDSRTRRASRSLLDPSPASPRMVMEGGLPSPRSSEAAAIEMQVMQPNTSVQPSLEQYPHPTYQQPAEAPTHDPKPISIGAPSHSVGSDEEEDDDADDGLTLPGLGLSPEEQQIPPPPSTSNPIGTIGSPTRAHQAAQRYLDPNTSQPNATTEAPNGPAADHGEVLLTGMAAAQEEAHAADEDMIDVRLSSSSDDVK